MFDVELWIRDHQAISFLFGGCGLAAAGALLRRLLRRRATNAPTTAARQDFVNDTSVSTAPISTVTQNPETHIQNTINVMAPDAAPVPVSQNPNVQDFSRSHEPNDLSGEAQDTRMQALDALGVIALYPNVTEHGGQMASAIRVSKTIHIIACSGYGSVTAYDQDLEKALSDGAHITVFLANPHGPVCGGLYDTEEDLTRDDADRTRRRYLTLRTKANDNTPRGVEPRFCIELRVYQTLGFCLGGIICDSRGWYMPRILPLEPLNTTTLDIVPEGMLWHHLQEHLRWLRKPAVSFPCALDAPIPVATFAMEKWVTVTPENAHQAFLPGDLILRKEGTMAAWVDLPSPNERAQATNNKFLWAATKVCGGDILDGTCLYYSPKTDDRGTPRWVNCAASGMIERVLPVQDPPAYTNHRVTADIGCTDGLSAGPHHFAVTWTHRSKPAIYLWIDGQCVAEGSLAAGGDSVWPQSTGSRLCIGHFPTMGTWFFLNWPLTGFAFFDQALSEGEIAAWKKHTLSVVRHDRD
ncbi:MAG: hypothetical protein ABFE08_17230 [Armatimonadia bacterium]